MTCSQRFTWGVGRFVTWSGNKTRPQLKVANPRVSDVITSFWGCLRSTGWRFVTRVWSWRCDADAATFPGSTFPDQSDGSDGETSRHDKVGNFPFSMDYAIFFGPWHQALPAFWALATPTLRVQHVFFFTFHPWTTLATLCWPDNAKIGTCLIVATLTLGVNELLWFSTGWPKEERSSGVPLSSLPFSLWQFPLLSSFVKHGRVAMMPIVWNKNSKLAICFSGGSRFIWQDIQIVYPKCSQKQSQSPLC